MSPDHKPIILAERWYEYEVVQLHIYFSQGSVAINARGGGVF